MSDWFKKNREPPPTHCEHCGGQLLYVRGSLYCERRCENSRAIDAPPGFAEDHPELVVKPQRVSAFAKAIEDAERLDPKEPAK